MKEQHGYILPSTPPPSAPPCAPPSAPPPPCTPPSAPPPPPCAPPSAPPSAPPPPCTPPSAPPCAPPSAPPPPCTPPSAPPPPPCTSPSAPPPQQQQTMIFQHPFTMSVSGPTSCGKTTFVKKLLLNNLIQPLPTRIIWLYRRWQPLYDDVKRAIYPLLNLYKVFLPN